MEAVSELKKRQKFIRGTKGKDMKLSVTIENLNTGAQLSGTGLVDSGATGTCINKEYVEKHELETRKLPIPAPVYNANGTLNEGGAIESYVEVRLVIGDHAEKIKMAVVNLGKTDFFLGLDWLRYHNPNIDWEQSTLMFDQCPDRCGYLPTYESPEDDDTDVEEKLEDGEHLYWMDWDKYVRINLRSSQPSEVAKPYLEEYANIFSKKCYDRLCILSIKPIFLVLSSLSHLP